MNQRITELLQKRGVALISAVPLKSCRILRPYKLEKCGFDPQGELTVYMLAVPYLAKCHEGNLSSYAVPRDYHGYFDALFAEVIPILQREFDGYRFCGFADNSPIAECDAAAKAGLGILGDNSLLITEKYSSFVFLGEIITDLPCPEARALPIKRCEGCGACKKACSATDAGCLSALTQKKGELSDAEKAAIKKGGKVWGCDRCQEVCPHTKRAIERGTIFTDVDYFKESLISNLTTEILQEMSDGDFALRAYSWRGRGTTTRNLRIFEDDNNLT